MMGTGPRDPDGTGLPGDDEPETAPADDTATAEDRAADEELMERLRRITATADPVPEAVMAAARAAFGLRDLDARVAELVRDSEVDAPLMAVRGAEARMLSYEADSTTIECEVMTRAGQRNVSGQLSGGVASAVEAQVPGGPPMSVPVSAHGWFTVHGLPSGPFRLRCRMTDGATIVTAWTSV
ncbi:MAG: hypothetical protein JWM19_4313 [Actinomycetia bacterium]|nr:hypothetical protein [Actinomycetes bacterium]